MLPCRVSAWSSARRGFAQRAPLAASRDPQRRDRRCRLPGANRRRRRSAPRRPRSWTACRRLRERRRDDRRHTRACRREPHGFALRRARGHGGHALAGEPAGERRPRESRPHEPCRTRPAPSRRATSSERRAGEAPRATSGNGRAAGATPDALFARTGAQVQAARDESLGLQAFTEVTRTRVYLTFLRCCRHAGPFVILTRWRVRARPAPDSDPVRRQGPERGSTGGGGRPRSFSSGPPHRRKSGALRTP